MLVGISIALLFVIYSVACTGVGTLTMHSLSSPDARRDRVYTSPLVAASLLLGMGLLAHVWLVLALAECFCTVAVIGVLSASVLCFLPFARPIFRDVALEASAAWRSLRRQPLAWQLIAGLVVLSALAGLTTLGRVMSGDSMALHMLIPKVVAASHRLDAKMFMEANAYYGLQGEMTYAGFMSLGSPDAAQLSSWLALVAAAFVFAGLCAKVGLEQRGRWLALACLFTSTGVLYWIGEGKIDLFHMAYGIAAYWWAIPTLTGAVGDARLRYRMAGLLTGLAVVAKLQNVQTLAPGIFLLLAWPHLPALGRALRELRGTALLTSLRSVVLPVVIASIWMSIAILPHLLKNGVMLGNPLAPVSADGRQFGWLMSEIWYSPEIMRRIQCTFPFALTWGSYWAQYGNLSPLVLAFLPLTLLLPRPATFWSSPLVALSAAAALILGTWLYSHPDKLVVRYFLASLLMWIPLAARAAEHVCRSTQPSWLGKGVQVLTAATLLLVYWDSSGLFYFPKVTLHYLTGTLPETGRSLPWSKPMFAINQVAEPGARVVSFSQFRYYLRTDLIQCADRPACEVTGIFPGTTAEERWRWACSRDFRFLLLDAKDDCLKELYQTLRRDIADPPRWVRLYPIYDDGTLSAYRIEYTAPPVAPAVCTREVFPGAWNVVPVSAAD
jgi:hypothetical protein